MIFAEYFRIFPGLPLISGSLATCMGLWPSVAWANCIQHLQGKAYTELPPQLCPGYSDLLLGQSGQMDEYGGVICDRPEASYILLQKLVSHNQAGQAIWQIQQIQRVALPNRQATVMSIGCSVLSGAGSTASQLPVFALVEAQTTNTYQTLSAWQVDLASEKFVELPPNQVACQDLLTIE